MKKSVFSLTELLVVIAILAILIMLLSPALRRISSQANSMQCLSNLKVIGTECLIFADDHDSILPHNSSNVDPITGKGVEHTYWTEEKRIPGYTANTLNYNKWYERLDSYDASLQKGGIHHCPNTINVVEPKWPGAWGKTYTMSNYLAGNVNDFNYGKSNPAPPPRLHEIATTAYLASDGGLETPWINGVKYYRVTPAAIGAFPGPNVYGGTFFWSPTNEFFGQGHLQDNQCNFVFLDGHTEGMTIEDYWLLATRLKQENPGYWGLSTAFQGGRQMSNL